MQFENFILYLISYYKDYMYEMIPIKKIKMELSFWKSNFLAIVGAVSGY